MSGKPSNYEREIHEQPDVLARLLLRERERMAELAARIQRRAPRSIVFVARGSSDNVARYGQYLLGSITGLPVALATPSLVTLYGKELQLAESLVIAISQSGQSPDVVAVVRQATRQDGVTVAITNDPGSPLGEAANHCIELHAGEERSIAATKTYTASLMALAMLASALDGEAAPYAALQKVPDLVFRAVSSGLPAPAAAVEYRDMESCAVISRGYNYATAFEVALKMKELAYVLAEPYSSADFWHGPIALVERDFTVMAMVADGPTAPQLVELPRPLRGKGGKLVVISPLEEALALAQTAIPQPSGIAEWLSPIVFVVPGQLFTLGLTLAKGLDPDHPRGLRKVTLSR
jgi:glucosamine--fructose-6-phosphate aminotransferase (isomerizing)